MKDFSEQLLATVPSLEGVTVNDGDGHEVTITLGRREVGHVHDSAVHVPFPRNHRDRVIEAGRAEVHPYSPDSGWVEVPLDSEENLDRARDVLRESFELAREANRKKTNEESS